MSVLPRVAAASEPCNRREGKAYPITSETVTQVTMADTIGTKYRRKKMSIGNPTTATAAIPYALPRPDPAPMLQKSSPATAPRNVPRARTT